MIKTIDIELTAREQKAVVRCDLRLKKRGFLGSSANIFKYWLDKRLFKA